jgi:cytochrome c553
MIKVLPIVLIALMLLTCNASNDRNVAKKANIQKGEVLFNSTGCIMCHSLTGQKMYGPPLNTILNTQILVIRKGKERLITVDRKYIQRSIQHPDYEKVINFQDQKMPVPDLSSRDIGHITDYLISINEK